MVAVLGGSLLISPAMSQSGGQYELSWSTTDAGGGRSTGGSYSLTGTVGQPEAGEMTGGQYQVLGGFWPGGPPACWAYLTQCHGDSDNTGDVKGSDFLALKNSWYKAYPDAEYDPCADFDRNGQVKGSDFLIFKSHWYQTVPADCPPGGVWPP
ncbi:MAG: hypothetical protein ACYTEQ_19810 [Planctomycetota bacterium]